MTHSENEVVEELSKQFDSAMQIDDQKKTEEEQKDFKPVFKSRKDRNTLNSDTNQRKKRKGLLVGASR